MNELVKITEKNKQQIVSARELHEFLESEQDFSNWIKRRIEKYGFIENQDYASFNKIIERRKGAATRIEYDITLDMAKELAMVEGNEKGKQARRYFISCEKKLKEQKPLSQSELLLQSAQLLVDLEKKQNILEQRVKAIEERPAINAPIEHFSIMGYCHNIGVQMSLERSRKLSYRCRSLCLELGLNIGKVSDSRYGTVNTYPLDVLKEIIGE